MYALWQILINSICAAAPISLVGVSFALDYMVSGFFNFTQAAFVAIGAYCAFFLLSIGLPLVPAIMGALFFCMCLAGVMELLVLRPLRQRGSSPLIFFLVTLGLYVVLQNVISLWFGDNARVIGVGPVIPGYSVLGARITAVQLFAVITSILLLSLIAVILRLTLLGKSVRAVGSDPFLAEVCGVRRDRVCLFSAAGTSALAGFAGILMGLDVDIVPSMGLNALMLGIVAATLGGVGNIPGLALGSLFLSVSRNFGIWRVGSEWQDAIAFVVLLVFLLFRPVGFLGKKARGSIP